MPNVWLYRFNIILFFCLASFAIGVTAWAINEFDKAYVNNYVPAQPDLGLPRYYGSCAGLVNLTYQALEDNRVLLSNLNINGNRKKLAYRNQIIAVIANAFTYSSTCQDKEAIGLMLTSDANITLDAAFNQIMPFNEAVPLARSYYNEANELGYYDNHRIEGFLLQERIKRNEFRVTIHAPF
jgi:hypothetical protein